MHIMTKQYALNLIYHIHTYCYKMSHLTQKHDHLSSHLLMGYCVGHSAVLSIAPIENDCNIKSVIIQNSSSTPITYYQYNY